MYVYMNSEPGLWTVGHYDPRGNWHSESDHDSIDKAADHVRYLNGGRSDSTISLFLPKLPRARKSITRQDSKDSA